MQVPEPGGHIDQLLRQTRAHHVQLSAQADTKANMLITVSGLIVPITLHLLTDPMLALPAMTMMGFAVLTIILAAYATMPKLGRLGSRRPESPGFNPLFFGDFVGLDYDTYCGEMEKVIAGSGPAYESAVREVYWLGQYLARRKYRYLAFAYLSFILGIAVSAIIGVSIYLSHWLNGLS